jgi:CBS domain containing-hemolysin-like protein
MLQIALHTLALTALNLLLVLFSYVYRLYQEKGRQASRRTREHLEHFHDNIAPRLRLDRRRGMQTFALLAQIVLVLTALDIGLAAATFAGSLWRAVFQTAFFVVAEILLVYQFVPYVLIARTNGNWLVPLAPGLRIAGYAVMPLALLYEFSVSLLHLAEEEDTEETEPSHALEALVEEGQERGLLEKDDVPLIASVLQFADKTAREVMTPRPEIVSLPATATLNEARKLVGEKRFSRMPVVGRDLDDVVGVLHVRDLLAVPEGEGDSHRAGELARAALFVPESKPVVELIRDLQREMQQMVVVVDEYGSVAGLVTTSDLAEEILGEINDADQVRRAEIVKESDTSYLVRGGVELERLRETLGVELPGEAATLAGLAHSWFGYVPKPGETLEREGVKLEILEATPRRVVRLRLTRVPRPAAVAPPAKKGRKSASAR